MKCLKDLLPAFKKLRSHLSVFLIIRLLFKGGAPEFSAIPIAPSIGGRIELNLIDVLVTSALVGTIVLSSIRAAQADYSPPTPSVEECGCNESGTFGPNPTAVCSQTYSLNGYVKTLAVSGYGPILSGGSSGALQTDQCTATSRYMGTVSTATEPINCSFTCSVGTTISKDAASCVGNTPPKGGEMGGCNAVGHPITPSNGNKFFAETDYQGHGVYPLEFVRYYNSDASVDGARMGAHWRHTYDRSIVVQTYTVDSVVTNVATIYWADGRFREFTSPDLKIWTPASDVTAKLARNMNVSGAFVGWTLSTDVDETEIYDVNGVLQSITNRSGLSKTLTYNGSGQLVQVADPNGRTLGFVYDANGRVSSVSDPAGQPIGYAYNSSGDLTSVTYQDKALRQYLYNESSYSNSGLYYDLTGVVDENGARLETVTYDSTGRASSSTLAGGVDVNTVNSYNATSALVTDALGTSRSFGYTVVNGNRKLSSLSSSGPAASCGDPTIGGKTYDDNGFVSSTTDFNQNITQYSADARGLVEVKTAASGTALARTTTTSWHPTYRLPVEIDEPDRKTVFSYFTNGDVKSETITDTSSRASRTTAYTYVSPGLVQTIDGPRTDISDITTFTYDSQENIASIKDALGHLTRFTQYDAHGNRITSIDANNVETDRKYDLRQRLIQVTVAGAVTKYGFDNAGNATNVTLPNGVTITTGYDVARRVTDVSDNMGNHIHYTLDPVGNRTKEDVYDPSGTLKKTLSRSVDSFSGRISDLLGASGQDTRYGYDSAGNPTSTTEVTQSQNFMTTTTFDALNRPSVITAADNGQTTYSYDAFGHVQTIKDPSSLTTSYTYDGLGNLTQLSSPDTGTAQYDFDSAGNIVSKTDARGITARYSFDALNRLTAVSYPNTSENVTYYYDGSGPSSYSSYGVGRLTAVQDQSGTKIYNYNARGTLASETHYVYGLSSPMTTTYTYDAADNLTSTKYPSGDGEIFKLNSLAQVSEIDAMIGGTSRVLASNIQYMPFGPWTQMTLGNGITTTRIFDRDYRISRIASGSALYRSYYYNDQRNNVSSTLDSINAGKSQSFGYDSMNRLSNATGSYGALNYTYNLTGDRLTSDIAISNKDIPVTYLYDSSSHHLDFDGVNAYLYDAAGNPTQIGLSAYGFNNAGRLSSSLLDLNLSEIYDESGKRIIKTVSLLPSALPITGTAIPILPTVAALGSVKTIFSYDSAGNLMQENASSVVGATTSEYFWLAGEPLAIYAKQAGVIGLTTSPEIYFFHNDLLGTPQVITDASSTVAWSADYQPFGTASITTQKIINNLRFAGQYADSEAGFSQNWHRDYNPSTGRYLESDPIGLVGGLNTYAYVGGNPIVRKDTSGLITWSGTVFNVGVGAGAFQIYTLYSECVNHQKGYARVTAKGLGFGEGITLGGSVISFDDGMGTVDPSEFGGVYAQISAGVSIGIGVGYSMLRLGSVDLPGDFGLEGGIDASYGAVGGFSTVTDSRITTCDCQ